MKIVIGSDHGGFLLKEVLKKHLIESGYNVDDVGCYEEKRCDYPDIALSAATKVARNEYELGILVCGTGTGMCMTANKVKGIRASLVGDSFSARLAKEHDNANVLCIGGRISGSEIAVDMIDCFLKAKFQGGRHQERLDKIRKIEDENFR